MTWGRDVHRNEPSNVLSRRTWRKNSMKNGRSLSRWIVILVSSAALATAQTSPPGRPKATDSSQDKTQKNLPGKTAAPTPPVPRVPQNAPATANRISTVDGNTLSKDQFRALPTNAVIQVQGKQVTKQGLLE